MQLVNCTPHRVDIVDADGYVLKTIQPSGMVARVTVSYHRVTSLLLGDVYIPVVRRELGQITDLPDSASGVLFIVSQVLASELANNRQDLLFPADLVRNEAGEVIGCRALARP